LPLSEYRPSARLPLAEVLLDLSTGAALGLARSARTPLDQAIVAAVAVAGGQSVRVAVAGASVAPILAEETGESADRSCQTGRTGCRTGGSRGRLPGQRSLQPRHGGGAGTPRVRCRSAIEGGFDED
jgi:hypothetical protein